MPKYNNDHVSYMFFNYNIRDKMCSKLIITNALCPRISFVEALLLTSPEKSNTRI